MDRKKKCFAAYLKGVSQQSHSLNTSLVLPNQFCSTGSCTSYVCTPVYSPIARNFHQLKNSEAKADATEPCV